MCYFNPHEREARDATPAEAQEALKILIHTSVKLVTALNHGPMMFTIF